LDVYVDFKKGSKFPASSDNISDSQTLCPVHDTVTKTWRHLNFFEHECYLIVRVPRIKTSTGSVQLIKVPWQGLSNGFTLLFEALILQFSSCMPINKVCKLSGVSNFKIWRLLKLYVESTLERNDYSSVEIIGVDETAAKRGHNYVSLFVDLKEKRVIFIAEGKSNKTIIDFSNDLYHHNGDPAKIKQVSCDMSPAFIKGIRENLTNAEITFDKFHIIKLINEAVDSVRREEVKTNTELKKMRYTFLTNRTNLSIKNKEKIDQLSMKRQKLKTMRAYLIRESFQELYQSKTEMDFMTSLNKWYFWATHSRLDPIIKVAKTIRSHWDGVVNWMRSKINNGILEGLNSVIQAAKAKARGFSTFDNFKTIIFLLVGKLNLKSINKFYLPI